MDIIRVIKGNLLNTTADVVAHQVNCIGIMDAGVAAAIRRKWPFVYTCYNKICKANQPRTLLGRCMVVNVTPDANDPPFVIANLFGQENIGRGSRQTNYAVLKLAMGLLRSYMVEHDYTSVAMPYGIGCGLAGGDWNVVMSIIERVFADSDHGNFAVELWQL